MKIEEPITNATQVNNTVQSRISLLRKQLFIFRLMFYIQINVLQSVKCIQIGTF